MQSTKWCFTLNNWTLSEYAHIIAWQSMAHVRYLVVGKELGAQMTAHLQGYVVFSSNKRLSALRTYLPRAHWEAARGNHAQAADYCKKDGDFVEYGDVPLGRQAAGGRERQRLADSYELAKQGRFDEVPGDVMLRMYRSVHQVAQDHMRHPDDLEDVCGVWIWGEAGCGKSSAARRRFPDFFNKPINKWWDGYQDEEAIILDDFDKSHHVLGHHLKIWADRYAFVGERKGGSRPLRPRYIVVTSQYSPEDIWDDEETRAAIRRRYHVIHMQRAPGQQAVIHRPPVVNLDE